jgi:chaperonin GroES
MKVEPLGNRLVVRRAEKDKKSKGGLLLPENTQDAPQRGEVLAVGPGKVTETGVRAPMSVKVGDVVYFTRWAGTEVKELGEGHLILNEEDVLGVIHE